MKRNDKSRGTIHCEHEPADIEKLDGAGYRIKKANKSIDAEIDEMRNRLELDDTDRPGLLVSDNCEHLIQEFLGYKEEHVGTSQAVDYCLDSCRYLCMGDSKPERKGGGVVIEWGSNSITGIGRSRYR